jgi:response regulator RpfG family c-di-GMP phosphodiesterase
VRMEAAMGGNEHMPSMHNQASPLTILIVGRDRRLNELFRDALKIEYDCVIFSATSGQKALEMAAPIKPDLLIIDDERLDLDALELSDDLHSITQQESAPTIIINARISSRSQRQKYPLTFLRKPFDVLQFYRTVKEALTA